MTVDYTHIKIQLLADSKNNLKEATSELLDFARIFRLTLHRVNTPFDDSFLITLPKSPRDFCHAINAFQAFSYNRHIGSRLDYGKSEELLTVLNEI